MSADMFQREIGVSRETIAHLDMYAAQLTKWNASINMVAPSTVGAVWSRHFLDSAQLLELAPKQARHWVDLGTGGGFPGLVIAVLAKEMRPNLNVTCIESDQRKAAFLSSIARSLDLGTDILAERIEQAPAQSADVVSARALAPLPRLLDLTRRHLSSNGIALLLKGQNHQQEISQALQNWQFDIECIPSKTEPDGVVLKIGDLSRA